MRIGGQSVTSSIHHIREAGDFRAKRMAAAFIPLLICYAAGAILSFVGAPFLFTESYYVSCPIPVSSVYETLSALTVSLKSTVWQTALLLFSVFTFFPWVLSTSIAVLRGICTGCALYAVSEGLVTGASSAESAVSLYFLASVAVILLSACSIACSDALFFLRSRRERKSTHALLFSYLRAFAVMSGGIFAISGFAVLFC